MTALTRPLHVGTIRGHQLRLYRTPNNDGRPDLPWHSVEDLYRCIGMRRDLRREFQRKMKSGPFGHDFKTVATPDGIVTIAPHYVAQGTISSCLQTGCSDIYDEYSREFAAALQPLTAPLPFGSDAFFQWLKAALNRHEVAA